MPEGSADTVRGLCKLGTFLTSVPWQNPSTSGACRKSGNWPCWDANKPSLGFTSDAVKFSGISTAMLSLMNRGGSVNINTC